PSRSRSRVASTRRSRSTTTATEASYTRCCATSGEPSRRELRRPEPLNRIRAKPRTGVTRLAPVRTVHGYNRSVRDFLGFLVILAVIFFVVGEISGWYLGVAAQTPTVVYKKDFTADTTRRTVMREDMPVAFTGQVRRGTVTVRVYYERSESFQTGQQGQARTVLFERAFRAGERIFLD